MNTSNALLNAFQLLKKDCSKESLFFSELYRSKFLCPVQVDTNNMPKNNNGSVLLTKDVPISYVGIADPSGKQYFMAFTDRNELSKWNKGKPQQTIVYSIHDYIGLLESGDVPFQGIVINPFSDNIVIRKEVLTCNNMRLETAKNNESIIFGIPKEYPISMVEKLKWFFRKNSVIKKAFLLWMIKGQDTGYLLVLETKDMPQGLFSQIGKICEPYLDNSPLDIVLLTTAFGQCAVKGQQPFYVA